MISRRLNCFLIVVSLMWFAGLASAASSFAANFKFCPIELKQSIKEEITALQKEVENMNNYVGMLAKPKDKKSTLDAAYKGICSELMQNASRLKLFHHAKQTSADAYNTIKPLIDQVLILIQDFLIDPFKVVERAPALAKAITDIRTKAKPFNAKLIDNANSST